MDYKIVANSSCDLSEDLKKDMNIEMVPFKISVEGKEFVDDENLDFEDLINSMNASSEAITTACPSPGDYLEAYKGSDTVFVVTISKELSGSYNSALLAKQMSEEEDKDRFIHVFNTKSASTGEILVALKIKELADSGKDRLEIVEIVEEYIDSMETMFILASLDNLIKNGRISKTKGLIATALKFVPIMIANDGSIELMENVRGSKKAFKRLVESFGELTENVEDKVLAITHVNALDKAEFIRDEALKLYNFKDIIIMRTNGLSGSYADDGGVILSY